MYSGSCQLALTHLRGTNPMEIITSRLTPEQVAAIEAVLYPTSDSEALRSRVLPVVGDLIGAAKTEMLAAVRESLENCEQAGFSLSIAIAGIKAIEAIIHA